jgi:hypothetical protein
MSWTLRDGVPIHGAPGRAARGGGFCPPDDLSVREPRDSLSRIVVYRLLQAFVPKRPKMSLDVRGCSPHSAARGPKSPVDTGSCAARTSVRTSSARRCVKCVPVGRDVWDGTLGGAAAREGPCSGLRAFVSGLGARLDGWRRSVAVSATWPGRVRGQRGCGEQPVASSQGRRPMPAGRSRSPRAGNMHRAWTRDRSVRFRAQVTRPFLTARCCTSSRRSTRATCQPSTDARPPAPREVSVWRTIQASPSMPVPTTIGGYAAGAWVTPNQPGYEFRESGIEARRYRS